MLYNYYDLSLAEDQLGDLLAEQAALEHAVSLQPGFAQAYNQLGYLATRRNDSGAAELVIFVRPLHLPPNMLRPRAIWDRCSRTKAKTRKLSSISAPR